MVKKVINQKQAKNNQPKPIKQNTNFFSSSSSCSRLLKEKQGGVFQKLKLHTFKNYKVCFFSFHNS